MTIYRQEEDLTYLVYSNLIFQIAVYCPTLPPLPSQLFDDHWHKIWVVQPVANSSQQKQHPLTYKYLNSNQAAEARKK